MIVYSNYGPCRKCSAWSVYAMDSYRIGGYLDRRVHLRALRLCSRHRVRIPGRENPPGSGRPIRFSPAFIHRGRDGSDFGHLQLRHQGKLPARVSHVDGDQAPVRAAYPVVGDSGFGARAECRQEQPHRAGHRNHGTGGHRDRRLFEVPFAAMTGYEALRSGAAWMDLSARGKIQLTGEDRARLLHAMTTNHIQQLTPGTGCYAFFLNDKGRVLADANVLCRPDSFLLDVEPETREPLYQHLDRFIIADDVTLEDATDAWATIAVEGPRAAEVLERAGAPIPDAEFSSLGWGGSVVARLNSTGSPG